MTLIIPKKLWKWSKIAVVSSSWWWPWMFESRYNIGKKQLQDEFGVQVVEMNHTLASPEFVYNNPQLRVQDFIDAFADPTIDWIISSIWWDDSIRMLPYIDFQIINNNPKVFLWYSDSTISHFICYKAWIRSYYWPSIMAWFGENWWLFEYIKQSVHKSLFHNNIIWEILPNHEWWTCEFTNWWNPSNQDIPRKLNLNNGWNFLQWKWIVQWELLGGCIDVFPFMFGTSIWPDKDQWKWKILFIETSEEEMSETSLERILRTMWVQWILHNLNWIIMWRAWNEFDYNDTLLKIINWEFWLNYLPIITNMDFGHTEPVFVLPIWATMTLDFTNQKVFINESGVL